MTDGRKDAAETALLALAETLKSVPRPGGTLYRGVTLWDDEQVDAVLDGRPFHLPSTRLSSWTTSKRMAKDFAGEYEALGNGLVIACPARDLDVIVDVKRVWDSLDQETRRKHHFGLSANTEREVIVRNPPDGILVQPSQIVWRAPRMEPGAGSLMTEYRRRRDSGDHDWRAPSLAQWRARRTEENDSSVAPHQP